MDVIAGVVVATSVFLFCMTLMVLFLRLFPVETHRNPSAETGRLVQRVMATSLVVYFVAVLDLLLIAQQTSLALGTSVVGLVLLVVFHIEPAIRTRTQPTTDEREGWEK